MKSDKLELKFWGVRGSIPVSGPEFERYGGNTSCIQLSLGGRHLLFDAGTGIREASAALREAGVTDIDLFFTHSHYDHIIGLPFFEPIYNPKVSVNLWSGHLAGKTTTRGMIDQFMRPPWFPVEPDICRATLGFRDFTPGDVLEPHPGIIIHTVMLNHPGGAVGYRIEWAGRIIALVYDTEHRDGLVNQAALDLMQGADLVVYDTTYTEVEMPKYRGFGHSTWQEGVKLAKLAGVKRLALFHHSPSRTDEELDKMQALARESLPDAFAAFDGQTISF
ncbi:MBL fold metallo-hydrolase [Rhizobium sp. HT1-10]|uniref:MBL fold metallo-hydrolase n=1 Tax=Rhizobium sp. HT1-10 TaxID=3111638 RepID=UPI003C29EA02